jgi:O-antigen ligase
VFNRDRLVRPNLFLTLYSLLAASALIASLRFEAGKGAIFRSGRFAIFLVALWLLTPLWGRRDQILLRWHVICLSAVVGSVVLGYMVAPGVATEAGGRLAGDLWPIPPTQVGHYAAMLAGTAFILAVARRMRARVAVPLAVIAFAVLLQTRTRTALIGVIVGALCGLLVLSPVRRRARQILIVVIVLGTLFMTVFRAEVAHWYTRGETAETVSSFNGRKTVWDALMHAPRTQFELIAGHGLTDKSFNGIAIDNSWLAVFQDEGLIGVSLCAAIFVSLLLLALTRRAGPALAVAVFIIVYCLIAATTETGLGDVSPYILDLTVAAALLAQDRGPRMGIAISDSTKRARLAASGAVG